MESSDSSAKEAFRDDFVGAWALGCRTWPWTRSRDLSGTGGSRTARRKVGFGMSGRRRGLVIGCGAQLGFAWAAVMLREVERELGWDAREADVLVGTSSGSELAAMLGSGRSSGDIIEALVDAQSADPVVAAHMARVSGLIPPIPQPKWQALGVTAAALRNRSAIYTGMAGLLPNGRSDATWLRDLGANLAGTDGWVSHPATWLVALDAQTGERVAFGSPGAPRAQLGDALAASWAVPALFPPVALGRRRYIDGGVASSTSADLIADLGLDEVVIIAPMTSQGGQPGRGLARLERILRAQMTQVVDREHRLLESRGITVVRVEPGPQELDAMGINFTDWRRRPETIAAARLHAPRRVRDALAGRPREGSNT